jgi:hypothetical protein
MASLSQYIAELEKRLGEVSGELAEINHAVGPFIERYQRQVLVYHIQLVRCQRDIMDLRTLRGEAWARQPGFADTALSRLVETATWAPVAEQYARVWEGKKPPQPILNDDNLPAVTPEMQRLYVEIVRHIHPNLADNRSEYLRRRPLMVQANSAYVRRDAVTLRALVDAYSSRSNLPAVVDSGSLDELHNRALKLEWVIVQDEGKVFELRHGDVARVLAFAQQAAKQGYDLLDALSDTLREELAQALHVLADLKKAN